MTQLTENLNHSIPLRTPNKLIGYRIVPARYSYNVHLVKERGMESAQAGNFYEETVGYFRSIEQASRYIFNHRLKSDALVAMELDESLESLSALANSITQAEQSVLDAVTRLITEYQLDALDKSAMAEAPEASTVIDVTALEEELPAD